MPHFNESGEGTWICQKCFVEYPATTFATWKKKVGNLCPGCVSLGLSPEPRPNVKYNIPGGPVDSIERTMMLEFIQAFPASEDATTYYHKALGFFRACGLSEQKAAELAKFMADMASKE